jgi:hypothetical protein
MIPRSSNMARSWFTNAVLPPTSRSRTRCNVCISSCVWLLTATNRIVGLVANGGIGNTDVVTVAVVPDPRHAIPLHGTFIGFPSDCLSMEVQVTVMSDTLNVIWAAPQPAKGRRVVQTP